MRRVLTQSLEALAVGSQQADWVTAHVGAFEGIGAHAAMLGARDGRRTRAHVLDLAADPG